MGKKTKEVDDKERQKEEALKRKRREEVATYLKNKVATKNAVIKGEKVSYFAGSKAVDCLMESRWATDPSSSEEYSPCIRSRKDAVLYCDFLLQDNYFIRAEKVEVKPKEERDKEDAKKVLKDETSLAEKTKSGKQGNKNKGQTTPDSPQTSKEKKKRKFRLKEHASQHFVDDPDDVYIWHFEPVGKSSYAIGLAVVFGAVAFSLRPLWPESSNILMWYFTLLLMALIVALVALYIVRYVLYGLVVIATGGRMELWLVPNLTNEKLGFFDSFKPLYSLKKKRKKEGKKASSKGSDQENSDQEDQGMSQDGEEQKQEDKIGQDATYQAPPLPEEHLEESQEIHEQQ
ncbi:hypothetical protein EMCRGX_G016005 [Ephydatia muelleri]